MNSEIRHLACGCKVTFGGLGKVLCLAHYLIAEVCEGWNAPYRI